MRALVAILAGLFAVTVGACVPQPASSGAVQCGEGNICPPAFECRFGRCCRASATLAECPTEANVPRVDDGSLTCDDEGRCPDAHGYECRQGRYCCPRDGNPATGPCARGAVGMPCTAATTCLAPSAALLDGGVTPGLCRRSVPLLLGLQFSLQNGYCSSNCNTQRLDSCGATGVCIGLGEESGCVARCRLPVGQDFGPCRTEPNGQSPSPYVCLPLAPGDRTNREGYCYPDCTVSPALCEGLPCNAQTHQCEARCTSTSCQAGQRCNTLTGVCEARPCGPDSPCAMGTVCNVTRRCVPDCRVTPSTCTRLQRCNGTTGLCGLL